MPRYDLSIAIFDTIRYIVPSLHICNLLASLSIGIFSYTWYFSYCVLLLPQRKHLKCFVVAVVDTVEIEQFYDALYIIGGLVTLLVGRRTCDL